MHRSELADRRRQRSSAMPRHERPFDPLRHGPREASRVPSRWTGDSLRVNGDEIKVLAESAIRNEAALGLTLGVDVGLGERRVCSTARAKRLRKPPGSRWREEGADLCSRRRKDVDATVVYGVNHGDPTQGRASKSFPMLPAPPTASLRMVKPLHESVGVEARHHDHHPCLHQRSGADRRLSISDLRRARSATMSHDSDQDRRRRRRGSWCLPELNGKLDGFAIRVPTINVSAGGSESSKRSRDYQRRGGQFGLLKNAAEGELEGSARVQRRATGVRGFQPQPGILDLTTPP